MEQIFKALRSKNSVGWVMEGDIAACFDEISHTWTLDNVPMDKGVLLQWLKAGTIEDQAFHHTEKGTPQGGIASPVLACYVWTGWKPVSLRM